MLTKADKNQAPVAAAPAEPATTFAILLEFENVIFNIRQAQFDMMKKLMAREKVTLDEIMFSRYCLHPSPAICISNLQAALPNKKLDAAQLTEDLQKQMADYLKSDAIALNPGVAKLLDKTHGQGAAVMVISALPKELADELVLKLGLEKWEVKILVANELEKGFPRVDAWLKAAKGLSRNPRRCLAVASSMTACKSALAADMRCVAVPDMFTEHQDFSGAKMVLGKLDDASPDELFQLIPTGMPKS